jgi:hypothetical protein
MKTNKVANAASRYGHGAVVMPDSEGRCGACGFANFAYSNGHELAADGTRGYRCANCQNIKPEDWRAMAVAPMTITIVHRASADPEPFLAAARRLYPIALVDARITRKHQRGAPVKVEVSGDGATLAVADAVFDAAQSATP